MTPRPSTKRGQRWLNQVSSELGEGQIVYLLGRLPWPFVLVMSVSPALVAPRGSGDTVSPEDGEVPDFISA